MGNLLRHGRRALVQYFSLTPPTTDTRVNVQIATFRPIHARAFETLNRAWLVEHGLLEPRDEQHLADPWGRIVAPGGQIFVATRGDRVVGTCAIVPEGTETYELVKLTVAASARGHGIGRRLVEACLAFAGGRGGTRVVLLSNSRLVTAIRLYESLGFRHRPLPADVKYATADVYMEYTCEAPAA